MASIPPAIWRFQSRRFAALARQQTGCSPLERKPLLGLANEDMRSTLLAPSTLPAAIHDLVTARPYMVDQISDFIHRQGAQSFDEMTSLSKGVRAALAESFRIGYGETRSALVSTDGTKKWLVGFGGGADVETVLIPNRAEDGGEVEPGGTVCVSSQVGCSLRCTFCHTGTQKLLRNLSASEILAQVMLAMRAAGDFPRTQGKRRAVTNIVLMGQGEPLLNWRNVSAALAAVSRKSGLGMAPWRVTLSTSGVAPLMEKVSRDLRVGLAVSLHAVTDELRDELVPLNKQYPISEVMNGCRRYLLHMGPESRHRRITFEYVMLAGVNDSLAEARQLVRLLGQLPAHVNLIPFNPWPGSAYTSSSKVAIDSFRNIVFAAGIPCHVRQPRGQDILAACGQLKSSDEVKRERPTAT
ncbi:hypothetical protein HDU87_004132 [Geranomyces variabilis]|uniref:Radical SAM core domain-containing protein n=1 Tax=Geranomyces variabilis TaxID=109894 RepID=A0AAD5TTA6_9FUNG|nr:hypothetical protein HDU87_004132 [Geranomyces variabilis]